MDSASRWAAAARATLPAASPVNRVAEQRAARAELARHIYAQYRPDLVQRLLRQAFHAVVHALESVPATTGAGVGAVLALLVVLVFVGLRTRLGSGQGVPVFGATDAARALASAAQLRAEAERLATVRDWSGAVIARMQALTRGLEERTIVDRVPGLTARELARRAGAALPGTTPALHAAAAVFDATRYGAEPAGSDAYQLVTGADTACQQATPLASARAAR
ncbi:MAG: DUF4129 domain-containing protein [Mycobacteriales bacterium]